MSDRLDLNAIFVDQYDKEHGGKSHKITLPNNTVHIRCEDPYGFWKISLEKGQLPEKFKGEYTTLTQAIRAAETWCSEKKLEPILPTKEERNGAGKV